MHLLAVEAHWHCCAHVHSVRLAAAPVVQAVLAVWLGPCRPWRMLTAPAAMFAKILGTKKGLMRRSLPCKISRHIHKSGIIDYKLLEVLRTLKSTAVSRSEQE